MADRTHHRSDRRERDGRDEDYGRQDRGKRRRESPHRRDKRRERSRSPIERPRSKDDRHKRRDDERDIKGHGSYRDRNTRGDGEHKSGHGHTEGSSSKEITRGERGSPHKPWFNSKDLKSTASSSSDPPPDPPPPPSKKSEPDFEVSGKLAAETNTLNGVLIKYSEPPEARVPKTRWRFYEFKGDEFQNTLHLHRQSAYLIGRDRKIVDFPIDHPSCSKQHAVLQYRLVDYEKEDKRRGKKVKPYIIDLESTNGTHVNGDRIDNRRYVELKEKDVVKFGFSTREYVLLHENSKGDNDSSPDANPSTTIS